MAAKTTRLRKLARAYARRLEKKIRVEQVILFGSHAYGRPRHTSDIDLAVVSPSFRRMNDLQRIMLLTDETRHLALPATVDVDVLGFTPQELVHPPYFDIAGEIKERGIVLYQKR